MGNYTPNPFMTQPIYDPTRPFAHPNCRLKTKIVTQYVLFFYELAPLPPQHTQPPVHVPYKPQNCFPKHVATTLA